jgi:hypothetical protein
MRYVLATCLVCLIGTPAAFATPQISSGTMLIRKPETAVEPAKQKVESGCDEMANVCLGGIHPLVGSGDY